MCTSHATRPPSLGTPAASVGAAASQQASKPAVDSSVLISTAHTVQNSTVQQRNLTSAESQSRRLTTKSSPPPLPPFILSLSNTSRSDQSRNKGEPKEPREWLSTDSLARNSSSRSVRCRPSWFGPPKKSFLSDQSPGITQDIEGITSGPIHIPKKTLADLRECSAELRPVLRRGRDRLLRCLEAADGNDRPYVARMHANGGGCYSPNAYQFPF